MHPEGPATGHLDTGFPWLSSVFKQIRIIMVPKIPSRYCKLLRQLFRLNYQNESPRFEEEKVKSKVFNYTRTDNEK